MTRGFLNFYQYAFPAVLTPLGYWLWWRHYGGDHHMAILAMGIPIVFAYVVPGIGTNILKVWEFDTRFRLGRFRPHHGFVFGSMTAMLTWLVFTQLNDAAGMGAMFATGFIVASVLGFWNWIYDIAALHAGILKVYNQPWSEGKSAAAIAADYAPAFFGGFGFVYGAGLRWAEWNLAGDESRLSFPASFLLIQLLSIVVPVGIHTCWSLLVHGHSGWHPCAPRVREKE